MAAGAVLVVAAACTLAIPSGKLPRVEQRWVVTPLRASIGMDELINQGQALSNATAVRRSLAPGAALPGGSGCSHSEGEVSIRSRNDEVVVNLGRTTLSCSLRALCPGCTSGRQPKPAFTHRSSEDVPLPNRSDLEVKSVRVIGGTVDLSLQHDLDFVPLGRGDLQVKVLSIGDQDTAPEELLAFSLDRDFVGGTPIRYTHHFSSHPVTVVGGVRLVLAVDSPADPDTTVDVDLSRQISVTAEVSDLTVSSVGAAIDKPLASEPVPVTVDDDTVSAIVDRVTDDTTITVTLSNPFPIVVAGSFSLGPAVTLSAEERRVSVRPGTRELPVTTSKELTISPEELQAFLEQGEFSFTGGVTTSGVVTFATDQEIGVKITVDVSLVTEPEAA